MPEPIQISKEDALGYRTGVVAWLEYASTRSAMGVLSRLPYGLQTLIGKGLSRIAIRVDKRHANAARDYIRQALGGDALKDDRHVLDAYLHLYRVSLDSGAFNRKVPQETLLDHYNIIASDEVRAAFEGDEGGIMVTAHIGDWEAGSAIMPHIGMKPAYAVSRPVKNRYLSKFLNGIREKKQLNLVPRRGGMRSTVGILGAGGWIAMLLDQRPRGKNIVASFFGRRVACERGAAVLIKRLGVPVVFGACYTTDRPFHYQLEFPSYYSADHLSKLSLQEFVELMNRELESLILKHPEQYLWLHDRYRDAPPREASVDSTPRPVR
ncbi:MAG: KDO2-lipid IV(A) lauroyltransferase [Planctomycetota bacterium]|jgi:KDO2-lipid IV(A) lauroyltransferase